MTLYPIGEQDFRIIREEGKAYVDKTMFIPLLLQNRYYFLSRPRRFGKSLLLSTLEAFFQGRRDLFKGLAIDSWKGWDWEEYPVIRIDFTGENYSDPDGLHRRLDEIFSRYERLYGLAEEAHEPEAAYGERRSWRDSVNATRFRKLIHGAAEHTGKRVAVLIDEYDKPLLDCLEDKDLLRKTSERLSAFYSVLKASDEHIKMAFLTGISRFGHLNVFSGINNLMDISLDSRFSAICGFTREELEDGFKEGIESLARSEDRAFGEVLDALRDYYDGYHFSRSLTDIYNPFSLMQCFVQERLSDYWFMTGSPSYLIRSLRKNRFDLSSLEGLRASESTLAGYDSSLSNSATLLYQSGYLTIKAYDRDLKLYTLGIPNREVGIALNEAIIPYYLGSDYTFDRTKALEFISYLNTGQSRKAMEGLQEFFGSISYDVKLDYEAEFQNVVYAFFALIGLMAKTTLEKQTSNGRIDMVLELTDYVYVFEFKKGDDAAKALEQIDSKDYTLQWRSNGRKVIKVGVAFSAAMRGIAGFAIAD